jgi:hypothetical protein
MNTRPMIATIAAALVLAFSGAAVAAERGAEAADAAEMAQSAMTADAGNIAVTTHVNADGESVACIAEEDLATILAWYKAEVEAKERRAQFEKDLEAFEVDP